MPACIYVVMILVQILYGLIFLSDHNTIGYFVVSIFLMKGEFIMKNVIRTDEINEVDQIVRKNNKIIKALRNLNDKISGKEPVKIIIDDKRIGSTKEPI